MKRIIEWWNNMFGKKKPVAPVPAKSEITTPAAKLPTFVDDFKSLENWIVSTWTAPNAHSVDHRGSFSAENATITPDGLCLRLIQTKDGNTTVSVGAEVTSKETFGYGSYEFVVKASAAATGAPISGSITGCFNYLPSSKTEIDIEVEGGVRARVTQLTSWKGETNPNQHTDVQPVTGSLPHQAFHTYKFVWSPGKIEFYRNGVLVGTHTQVVPSMAAPMMFNHWGTNDPNWGGSATPDVERFMYVKRFSFTPL